MTRQEKLESILIGVAIGITILLILSVWFEGDPELNNLPLTHVIPEPQCADMKEYC